MTSVIRHTVEKKLKMINFKSVVDRYLFNFSNKYNLMDSKT